MHNNFRARLLNGDFLVGTFQKTPSLMISEVLGKTDLAAVCLDAEHSPFDRRDIDACVLALRAEQMPSLVRVPSAAPEQILNALDCGATGIVVPHVDSADKARRVVKASRYVDGGRGYAGSTRSALYAGRTIEQNKEHNHSENTVIAQIEDLAALDEIGDIVSVDGLDCLFIGMADFAAALGCRTLNEAPVIAAAERVCAAAKAANRRVGIFVPDLAAIPRWRELGVSLFLLGSEHGFIKSGAQQMLNETGAI